MSGITFVISKIKMKSKKGIEAFVVSLLFYFL